MGSGALLVRLLVVLGLVHPLAGASDKGVLNVVVGDGALEVVVDVF